MSIRSLPCQFLEFMEQNRFICPGVINDVQPSLCAVSKLFCANVGCVVFVAFFKYFRIRDKSFIPSQNSQHSWNSSLEKPNKLVQVMQWYFVRLCKNKHRLQIPASQGLQRSTVLTRRDWEVGVGIRPDIGPLGQFIDKDER